jgi:hypothetical protein
MENLPRFLFLKANSLVTGRIAKISPKYTAFLKFCRYFCFTALRLIISMKFGSTPYPRFLAF